MSGPSPDASTKSVVLGTAGLMELMSIALSLEKKTELRAMRRILEKIHLRSSAIQCFWLKITLNSLNKKAESQRATTKVQNLKILHIIMKKRTARKKLAYFEYETG